MKTMALVLMMMFCCTMALSQPQLFTNNSPDDVVKIDSRQQHYEYVPGQILVRFKDEVRLQLDKTNGLAKTGMATVDALFEKYQVTSAAKLIKDAQPFREKKYITTFSGRKIEKPNLHNIYQIQIKDEGKIFETIDELKKDSNVEYAEPNYIYSVVDDNPVSDILTEQDVRKFNDNHQSLITPNDPYYSQQWYISTIHADTVWSSTTGDTSQVIGILDTGVDWLHPDLANKIWLNHDELNKTPGFDDDGNGYVDDIRGWDFINNDNNPRDDNSHGTHVAGIAAAEANNGIGIAGVNWKAKIMPIKVFQSSGYGDAATITQGIVYAMSKGATVINMSFGSYTRSLTMEAALANAYAHSILVAAAGNDGICIGPGFICKPFFPAALSYVLGIQATTATGKLAEFSNFDQDGPVYSQYTDLFNYELLAPGEALLSTVPNGNYRIYSGTSMATPVVSGAVALYRQLHPTESQEMMWGNLINTSSNNIDLFAALHVQANPVLWFVSQMIVDTLDGDRDGRVDAGETIELWYMVRNTWGQADSVFVGIRFGEFEDTSVAQIQQGMSFIGSVSAYTRRSNEHVPFRVHISTNVANDRDIVFQALIWNAGSTDTVRQGIVLRVENGSELAGVMDTTLVLTPDRLWLVNESFRIGLSGLLILKPGLKIILNSIVVNNGSISAAGTPDSIIIVEGPAGFRGIGTFLFSYTRFESTNQGFGELHELNMNWRPRYSFDHCTFANISTIGWHSALFYGRDYSFSECIFYNCKFAILVYPHVARLDRCNFDLCYTVLASSGTAYFTNFSPGNYNNFNRIYNGSVGVNALIHLNGDNYSVGNNFLTFGSNTYAVYVKGSTDFIDIIQMKNQYWGTADSIRIRKKIFDFWSNPLLPMLVWSPFLSVPSDSAHGIVWKVLVNGIDPQDEHLDPIGVGTHRFDVYFNREMDTTYTPQLSFGVREPYTQQAVVDSGRWSPDHKIWTTYKTIKLHTGDGINRIRVAGARDLENFEIPIEDQRFEFLIDAAGSASTEFTAHAGLGKINLEWNKNDLVDLLGFNMYRFTNVTDTTYTDPVLINQELITDTLYTDYDVVPGNKYYYEYKVVRTDFSESDFSKVIGATALTSSAGDANGDLAVNVLDIMSIVSYILGQNPQPFILEASDINNDSLVNVLDIIGVVNIILDGSAKTEAIAATGNARIELTADQLDLSADVPVAGIQFKLSGSGVDALQFIPNSVLGSFEVVSGMQGDSSRTFILFSMSGAAIPIGQHTLGTFQGNQSGISITEAIISNSQGQNIVTSVYDNGVPLIPTEYYLYQNYPNPFNASTKIQYGLPERSEVKIYIYNILGQQVKMFELGEINAGRYEVLWEGKNNSDNIVASGIYFYRFVTPKYSQVKKLVLIK